ncbi:MAG: PbpA [Desulfobacterales bacterium]|nr:PbpA [Desulfobacterales bacterium]
MHPKKNSTPLTISHRAGWRDYQDRLNRTAANRKRQGRLLRIVLLLAGMACVGWAAVTGISHFKDRSGDTDGKLLEASPLPAQLDKLKLQSLLASGQFLNLKEGRFYVTADNRRLRVDTSLDIKLQNFLQGKMNTAHARQIAMVVLAPNSGRVISMVGFDKKDPGANACLDNEIPAASVFKIVTAAAAMDVFDFNPDTVFLFNGAKHTLYKRQLKEKKNRYTNRITFIQSFAQSVNPVFGKLGAHHLGRDNLEKFSRAFGFNQQFGFEIPLAPSRFTVNDDPYHWAELASGFNRTTTISPLHGALMAAAIANSGQLVEPTIVDRVTDDQGQVVYTGTLKNLDQVISPDTSTALGRMMTATIRSGTCQKIFRGYRRDKVLSRLTIGGKSGSISNRKHDARYDWFVGFAKEKTGTGKIAIAVLVAHEKYIGLRAAYYARLAIKRYFSNYFFNAQNSSDGETAQAGVS